MSRSPHRSVAPIVAATLFAALVPLSSARAARPVERHNWTVGLGVNTGSADVSYKADTDLKTEDSRGAAPQFRFGKMIGPHLMIGLEDRQWLDEAGLQGYKLRMNFQNVDLVVTAYPGKTTSMASGFFLQAGFGLAHARASALEPYPGGANQWGETYEVVKKVDEGGTGYMFGAGYELRVSSHAAVGLAVSYNSLTFDDEIFDSSTYVPFGLNFNWYF